MRRMLLPLLAGCVLIALSACHAGAVSSETPSLAADSSLQPQLVASAASSTPAPRSKVRSSYGRIGLMQVFDDFPSTGTHMTSSQISSDAGRYDWVWGSFTPKPWRAANTSIYASRYYIIEEDNELISGHTLSWWKSNHPDWMLYACTSAGAPTHDYAYVPGVGFPDVVLNIHNPSVVAYQVKSSLIPYARTNGYNALALDQVIFRNITEGGNPKLGQTIKSGEYGCGVWNTNGTFTKIYSGPTDPTFTSDVINWVATAKSAASSYSIAVAANHPAGSPSNSNEQALIRNVDITLDEAGFTDYGNAKYENLTSLFASTYNYAEWVQRQGKAIGLIAKYYKDTTTIAPDEIEYAIGTYLMANEGNAELFTVGNNGSGYGYGAEQYHSEYATQLGAPCAAMYGGSSYDSSNPQIYYRRFAHGLVVVNSGSKTSSYEYAKLPAHTYVDLERRAVHNPLAVTTNDAWVLTTPANGCS